MKMNPSALNPICIQVVEARVDHSRVVDIMRRAGQLPLVKEYLLSVQKNDLQAVNEAVNELLIAEGDADGLRDSITSYTTFDQLALAGKLEKHDNTEFRRLAALIYKRNLKWHKAVSLAKSDELYEDAIETAAQSGERAIAEDLLRFFVEQGATDHFSACLETCKDLIRPDVAMEVAWRNKLSDAAMPYLIGVLRDYTSKIDLLMHERKEAQEAGKASEEAKKQQEQAANAYLHLNSYLALPPAPNGSAATLPGPAFGGALPETPGFGDAPAF